MGAAWLLLHISFPGRLPSTPPSITHGMGMIWISPVFGPKTGDIHIVPIPCVIEGGSRAVDLETICAVIARLRPHKIGAMGTSAKVAVRKAGVQCDFEVDVIQSSILAALRGLDVMVFATGGMADRVIRKIEGNNTQGGQQIKYLRLL